MAVGIDAQLSPEYDLQIDSNGDIQTKDFFDTALLMSIFCERRANESEIPDSHLRRGWIGNESTQGFEIGSKLWLYEQSRVTLTVLRGIETVILDGLRWLIDDEYAINISVNATIVNQNINVEVIIERPGSRVERRFFDLWNNTGVS